ncbi:unnamed protein product [Nesidiocoris tenuis]|uniref:Fibronectin type-III domain-containing protein n=1 Tax=Nesidiocoris tenuis TaxID=355587 RepID=A0A6H5G5D5_9HEMI|nr:unnamed protein product [Nesidiocoris tenuis]
MRDGDATCEGPGSWQSHLEEGGSIPAQLTAAPPPGAAAETARTGSQTFTSLVRLLPPLHHSQFNNSSKNNSQATLSRRRSIVIDLATCHPYHPKMKIRHVSTYSERENGKGNAWDRILDADFAVATPMSYPRRRLVSNHFSKCPCVRLWPFTTSGPMTVPMVSTNSSPPIAMPVQVPHGHVVQQIVDESGTLRHVILSPQHPPPLLPIPQHFVIVLEFAPGSPYDRLLYLDLGYLTTPLMYLPVISDIGTLLPFGCRYLRSLKSGCLSGGFDVLMCELWKWPRSSNSRPPRHPTLLRLTVPPSDTPVTYQLSREFSCVIEKPNQCLIVKCLETKGAGNPSGSTQGPQGFYPGALPHSYHQPFTPLQPGVLGHGPPQGHSPPPHNYHGKDERAHRQYNKLKKRLEQKQMRDHPLNTTPPLSPRKEINGNSRKGVGSVGTSEDGEESSSLQDDEDDLSMLTELLGSIKAPQVSEVTSRTALVQWSAPQVENPQDLSYEVLLSDRGKEGKYKSIYTGEALSCRIEDLRPGTEYSVCVSARLENAIGCASEPTQLVTPACRPDAPPAPKLSNRTRNSLTLKWLAAQDNGAHIEHYIVEWDVDGTFQEVAKSKAKQSHIGKLQPASAYIFRVAAVNQYGKSDYSPTVEYQTCDSPPPQPVPPSLVHATPGSLTLQWQSRPQDDDFTLQMEDPDTRHGYLPVYSGKDTLHVCQNLRRNTSYKFRIRSQNDDGPSKWSEEVTYTTLPGRPGPPSRPQLKGKIHLHSFRLRWDPPNDRGGAIINGYTLEIMKYKDCSGAYEVAYHGASPMCTIERLEPGTAYQVRVNCEGPGGLSDYSEPALLATEPVCPGQCSTPRLHGKPKPHSIPIKWSYPDSDGGSPVTEMEVGVKRLEVDDEIITAYKGRETECTVNDLIPAQTYAFMVRASNKVGPGAWSLPLEVTSGSCAPSRPPAPVVGHLPGGVSVAWTPPAANGSPITLYVLQMSTPPCESYSSVYSGSAPHCEVKPVPPATICVFRVQATNSVGSSDWSELGTIVTNPGTPGSVPSLRYTATPTSMTLHWGAPSANGDPVTHYTVEAGDVTTNVPATATTTTLDNLIPNTTYKIRVRGVNSVGPGAASTLRAMTLPLPPTPPQLSCATAGHNYLKLRWGPHNTNPNNYTFTILMTSPTGYVNNFHLKCTYCSDVISSDYVAVNLKIMVESAVKRSNVYEGTGTSCKVTRLLEQTSYSFTIIAANRTGKGPESEAYTFTTVIAPPPSVKGLKTTNVTSKSCHVEWAPLRQQGNDSIEYTVQCARLREQTYKQVYQGRETSVEIKELDAGAEYLVKICAIRQSPKGPVEGPYSSPINVSTPPIHHETPPQHFVRPHAHQVCTCLKSYFSAIKLLRLKFFMHWKKFPGALIVYLLDIIMSKL